MCPVDLGGRQIADIKKYQYKYKYKFLYRFQLFNTDYKQTGNN